MKAKFALHVSFKTNGKYVNADRAMWRLHEEDKNLTNQGMESHYSETLPKVSKSTRNTCVACGILFKLGKLLMKYQGKAKLRDETVVVEW